MTDTIVKLENIELDQAIKHRNELIKNGLTQDVDFTWKWHSGLENPTRYVEFFFKDEVAALLYKLKWE
jgi:hypothetical protein